MRTHPSKGLRARTATRALLGGALATAVACGDILNVKNPNDVPESALGDPAAAAAIANGVLAATVRMLMGVTTPYAVTTDELDWIGSRDAWLELDRGGIGNFLNEFSDQAFPFVGEARYAGDEGIQRLLFFDTSATINTRPSRSHLARAYLYTAITYATIADMYDDYAFSNKREGAAPIGRANMSSLYDTAVVYLDRALVIANAGTGTDFTSLRYPILAYRARVKHAKAVWQKVTPKGTTPPAAPLVNDAGANTDATNAIALGTTTDQRFTLAGNIEARPDINIWFEVNGRNENRTGTAYRTLNDPVTGALDPTVQALLSQFTAFGPNQGVFTLTSTRELWLILAEASLEAGDIATFTTRINTVRAMDTKPNWAGTPSAQAILEHERRAQLWLMRRRLLDMHRFGVRDPLWVANPNFESTFSVVGLLFPIPNVERLGNVCINTPTLCP
jgi:hypothetical protein